MPVFLEKYLLPITVTLTVLVMFTNPMNLDWNQRISGGLALLLGAYFVAHTVQKMNEARKTVSAEQTDSMRIVPSTYLYSVGLLNQPPPVRPQQTAVARTLYVDCIVSQLNEVFFVDLRMANKADTPLLISAVQVRARSVESMHHRMFRSLENPLELPASQAYDIDISTLRKASDVVSEPLAQAIEPKATDRFILRLSARPRLPEQDVRIVFDVEITTSEGIILLENQVAVFTSAWQPRLLGSRYFDELNAISERRSGAKR